MLLRCSRPSQPLLRHTDVPQRVTESFILSGYRFPNYSLRECLASAFRPTNETGNFWTHFLAVFVFAFHFLELFGWEGRPSYGDPFFYPFWNYFIGVFLLLMASSLAHLLNSMSLLIREICFFVDYGTISAYTVGSSLAYFYYIHPRAGITALGHHNVTWEVKTVHEGPPLRPPSLLSPPSAFPEFHMFFESFYIPSACVVALICTLACCNTRQRWRRHRYVIRTLVFLLPFIVASTPIFYRLLRPSVASAQSSSLCPGSLGLFFSRHCFWLLVSALFNISKFPERLSPGKFDIWGHSHQWFHCCTFLSILDELHMIKAEIRALALHPALTLPALAPPPLPGPTLYSTYGVMFTLQGCIGAIISWFSWGACRNQGTKAEHLKSH
ncbi:membrane progesterone receptor epsilon [Brienomyrus brachyistius]|uniref:membrane progesterone receptor epsilon n=1 Tax=Brienomyrus brachyistius TaxID=42636 RepID=UPI0020B27D1F|nr:membrane progesterone receptor epsilon [Brienomyrus brachyistius]XP_048883841.1 membrane progesterone receptor epsilon [Brienomyrus brachyistius]